MSAPHSESFFERHWYIFLILFGLLFVSSIDLGGGPSKPVGDPHIPAVESSSPSTESPSQ